MQRATRYVKLRSRLGLQYASSHMILTRTVDAPASEMAAGKLRKANLTSRLYLTTFKLHFPLHFNFHFN